jgi:hypothetical protein
MKLMYLLLLGVSCQVICSDNNYADGWFTTLLDKPASLLRCKETQEGIKFRLPKVPTCTLPTNTSDSKVVDLTIFWEDINHASFTGHECWGTKQGLVGRWKYYVWETMVEYGEISKIGMTEEECRKMVRTSTTPEGERMERMQEGYYGTKQNAVPVGGWFQKTPIVNTNYYAINIQMNVGNRGDSSIKSTANTVSDCPAESGTCQTVKGILVWTPSDYKSCRMKEGQSTKCLETEGVVTCPEIHMSLSNIKLAKICNRTLGLMCSQQQTKTKLLLEWSQPHWLGRAWASGESEEM